MCINMCEGMHLICVCVPLGISIRITDLNSRMWEELQVGVSRREMFKEIGNQRKPMVIPGIKESEAGGSQA